MTVQCSALSCNRSNKKDNESKMIKEMKSWNGVQISGMRLLSFIRDFIGGLVTCKSCPLAATRGCLDIPMRV